MAGETDASDDTGNDQDKGDDLRISGVDPRSERSVQNAAVRWLAEHYGQLLQPQVVVYETEVTVAKPLKKKGYWGRVDGLVVARLSAEDLFVAAVEAKSRKTRGCLCPSYNERAFWRRMLLASLLAAGLAAIPGLMLDGALWPWLLPLGSGVLMLVWHGRKYEPPVNAVFQATTYPADEQWLAVSQDAINSLTNEMKDSLYDECRFDGVGLLVVSEASNVELIIEPVRRKKSREYESCLSMYSGDKANFIRSKLVDVM